MISSFRIMVLFDLGALKIVYQVTMDYWQLSQEIKHGPLKRVYFFDGEEEYLKSSIIGLLKSRVCSDESLREFNLDQYMGNETNLATITNAVNQFPMMAESRLIILSEADRFISQNKDKLFSILESLPETACLCFRGKKFSKNLKIIKQVGKFHGLHFSFGAVKRKFLMDYIKEIIKDEGLNFSSHAFQLLFDVTENDVGILTQEVRKIALYKGKDSPSVQPSDILAVSESFKSIDVFSIVDKIVAGKGVEVLIQLREKHLSSNHLLPLLGLLHWHFKVLLKIKILIKNEIEYSQIGSQVGVQPFRFKQFYQQAGRYKYSTLTTFVQVFNKASLQLKTSALSSSLIFDAMVLLLATKNPILYDQFKLIT